MLYQFPHKTGKYLVEIIDEKQEQYLVQVLAVLKHPKQGDLHHPNEVNDVFFHERKALSQYEKRYTSSQFLKPYDLEKLDYIQSLQYSLSEIENKMKEKNSPYHLQSLKCIEQLKVDYSRQYKTKFE